MNFGKDNFADFLFAHKELLNIWLKIVFDLLYKIWKRSWE